jgi:hypothetical protein
MNDQGVGIFGLSLSIGSEGFKPVESLPVDLPAGRLAPVVPILRRPGSLPASFAFSSPLLVHSWCLGSGFPAEALEVFFSAIACSPYICVPPVTGSVYHDLSPVEE